MDRFKFKEQISIRHSAVYGLINRSYFIDEKKNPIIKQPVIKIYSL